MRKLLALILVFPAFAYSQTGEKGQDNSYFDFYNHELGAAEDWDEFRDIREVNDTASAELYPYLSADGLRLYFLSERNGEESFYVSERKSKEMGFGSPKPLSTGLDSASNFSLWLTNDELEVFFISRNSASNPSLATSLYYSKRDDVSAVFQDAQAVTLKGAPVYGFLAGPSLSSDQKELFLFHNYFASNAIYRFSKAGELEYEFLDSLELPHNFNPGPGQLSKNGLKYVFSNFNDNNLYYMSREKPWYSFKKWSLARLDGDLAQDTSVMVGLPSISADEDQIVCVHYDYSYKGNDLLIVEGRLAENITPPQPGKISIFPNPVSQSLTVSGNNLATAYLLSVDGKALVQTRIESGANSIMINVSELPHGFYLLKVCDTDGQWLVEKVVKE